MSLNKYLKYKIKYYNLKYIGGAPNISAQVSSLLNEIINKENSNFEEALAHYNKSGKELLSRYQDLLELHKLCNKYKIACNINERILDPQIEHIILPTPEKITKHEPEYSF